jgi:hypothetical protein
MMLALTIDSMAVVFSPLTLTLTLTRREERREEREREERRERREERGERREEREEREECPPL